MTTSGFNIFSKVEKNGYSPEFNEDFGGHGKTTGSSLQCNIVICPSLVALKVIHIFSISLLSKDDCFESRIQLVKVA